MPGLAISASDCQCTQRNRHLGTAPAYTQRLYPGALHCLVWQSPLVLSTAWYGNHLWRVQGRLLCPTRCCSLRHAAVSPKATCLSTSAKHPRVSRCTTVMCRVWPVRREMPLKRLPKQQAIRHRLLGRHHAHTLAARRFVSALCRQLQHELRLCAQRLIFSQPVRLHNATRTHTTPMMP